ncbi:MAG: proline dehydrogenase family protein [Bacteroidetes bacterium]|nr:proline dehydrogenase family protein [Bacteroidota bacterium]
MAPITDDIFENTEVAFAHKTDAELQKAKWLFSLIGNNKLVGVGTSLAGLALKLHLPISPIFRLTVYDHFCGGETFAECKKTIAKLKKSGVYAMLNYGVELKEEEEDFDKTIEKNIEAIEFAGRNKDVKVLCIKITGFGRFGLFEKIQAGEKLTTKEEKELERVVARMDKVCKAAADHHVAVYVDAEESWIQDPLDAMTEEMMAKYNKKGAIVYNTFQHYRHDRLAYLRKQLTAAQKGGYILGAKLVRGAYMEKERERAAEMGYASPIHADKPGVDKDYDAAVNLCLDHIDTVSVCVASHSEESTLKAIKGIDRKGVKRDHPHVLFSQLYGMGDNITFNLAATGFNACKYLPYGPVKDVIPYLIRRAQENTSVAGQTGRELDLIQREIKRRRSC